jgi:hypothetical protein
MRRHAIAATMVLACALAPAMATAQSSGAGPSQADTPLGANLSGQMLRDLPSGNNLFSLLETTQPNVISDRFYDGGLNFGSPARVGAFLNSWTQTQYRVGGVDITAPDGSGSPFLFPTLLFWDHANVATGIMGAGVGTPGLGVGLEPRAPTDTWTRVVDATFAGSGLVASPSSSAPAPAIETLTGWKHAAFLASGPVTNRLGLVAAVDWNESSQVERYGTPQADGRAASLFANAVYALGQGDAIRTIGWYQHVQAPYAPILAVASPTATSDSSFTHLQSTWERARPGLIWRLSGAYSQRDNSRTDTGPAGATPVIERLTDGPAPLLANSGDRTDRSWSLSFRAAPDAPPQPGISHALQFGADLSGGSSRVGAFSGSIGELVDGMRARMWTFTSPGEDAHRHETSLNAFAADRIQMGGRITAELGLAYDSVHGSADGATQGIGWNTLLPNASIWWAVSPAKTWIFAAYRRAADALPLDTLAFGDPAAATGTVSAWTAQGVGPLVARIGPGTGGNPAFSAIDPALSRPITDELTVGAEYRPNGAMRFRLSGVIKEQRDRIDVVNTGVPFSSYTLSTIVDGRPASDGGSVLLPVYNRLPSSFGHDQYLLTNATTEADTFSGVALSAEINKPSWTFLFGATASQTSGLAGNRGFHVDENDPSVLGEVFTDPNANNDARGRLFFDRAFTIKLASVHHFSHDLNLGMIARYQDGQPFSRVTVVPDLNQGTDFVRAYPSGDARFNFTGTFDLRLQKGFAVGGTRVEAIMDAYNLFNFGYEVEESVVTGPSFRTITAIQPPLAFHFGFRVTF